MLYSASKRTYLNILRCLMYGKRKNWMEIQDERANSLDKIPMSTLMIFFGNVPMFGLADGSSEAVNESGGIKIG